MSSAHAPIPHGAASTAGDARGRHSTGRVAKLFYMSESAVSFAEQGVAAAIVPAGTRERYQEA